MINQITSLEILQHLKTVHVLDVWYLTDVMYENGVHIVL